MERNTLMAKCYPKIKDYCREKHGLEFQVRICIILQKFEIIFHNKIEFVNYQITEKQSLQMRQFYYRTFYLVQSRQCANSF